jgi:hypothetical protein
LLEQPIIALFAGANCCLAQIPRTESDNKLQLDVWFNFVPTNQSANTKAFDTQPATHPLCHRTLQQHMHSRLNLCLRRMGWILFLCAPAYFIAIAIAHQ